MDFTTIIAVIIKAMVMQTILTNLDKLAILPRIAPVRGPAEWYEDSGETSIEAEDDPLVQPEPGYESDQQVSW